MGIGIEVRELGRQGGGMGGALRKGGNQGTSRSEEENKYCPPTYLIVLTMKLRKCSQDDFALD